MTASFERFCLAAGIETLSEMMEQDAEAICGSRHARAKAGRRIDGSGRRARSAFTAVRSMSSVRAFAASTERSACCRVGRARSGRIGSAEFAMNEMLIAVSTRKSAVGAPARGRRAGRAGRRSVEIGDLAPLRRAVCGGMRQWICSTRSTISTSWSSRSTASTWPTTCCWWRRICIDATGEKHPLGLVEGATENAAMVRALIAELDRPGPRSGRARACSSSTDRRRCRRRSGAPSGATRRSVLPGRQCPTPALAVHGDALDCCCDDPKNGQKGFRRLKAHKQLPASRAALDSKESRRRRAASCSNPTSCIALNSEALAPANFKHRADNPPGFFSHSAASPSGPRGQGAS